MVRLGHIYHGFADELLKIGQQQGQPIASTQMEMTATGVNRSVNRNAGQVGQQGLRFWQPNPGQPISMRRPPVAAMSTGMAGGMQ